MRNVLAVFVCLAVAAVPCAAQYPDGYFFSEPPILPDFLVESYNDGRVDLSITRSASTAQQRRLLRIAEGLLPNPEIIQAAEDSVLESVGSLGNHARNFAEARERSDPRWAWTDFEELTPYALHGNAIEFYSERVQEYAVQMQGTESTMTVEYDARVVELEAGGWEVRMQLNYRKLCGMLCGFWFQHERVVTFDSEERVVGVEGDRPARYAIS